MYKQAIVDDPEMNVTAIVSKIVDNMGVANSTVYRTIKEYRETGKITEPKKIGGRPGIIKTYDERIKTSVRQIVHGFFYKNELPTLDKISSEISRSDLPKMSRSSLYTFMKQINFK